jgi:hypothetical protein
MKMIVIVVLKIRSGQDLFMQIKKVKHCLLFSQYKVYNVNTQILLVKGIDWPFEGGVENLRVSHSIPTGKLGDHHKISKKQLDSA